MTFRHGRSPVPDLLYEDEQESRVHELALPLEEPELVTWCFHLPDPARLDLEGARLRYTLV